MISFTLGIALAVLVGLAFIVLFVWLWKKLKKKPVAGGTIGFFVGIIAATGIMVIPSRAYVIHGDNDYSHYLVYSSTSYTTSDNKTIDINIKQTQCVVINDTKDNYSVETVIYGFGFGSVQTLEAHSHLVLDHSKIDYFFDEEPPESIETESSGNVSMLWLRKEKNDDVLMNPDALDSLEDMLSE